MITRVLLVMTMLAITVSLQAQSLADGRMQHRHELSVGIGDALPMAFTDAFGFDVPDAIINSMLGNDYTEDSSFSPLLTVSYGYRVSKRNIVSARGTYCEGNADIFSDEGCISKAGERHEHYFSIQAALQHDWIQKRHFTLYSKLAAGAIFINYKRDCTGEETVTDGTGGVMMQVNPVGIEVGGQQVMGYMELGFGQTIMEIGLKVRL